jgi:hypothetical protein
MRKVLNVGGFRKDIAMPAIFQGWQPLWLDIDPKVQPDILGDARELVQRPAGEFDAIYCSHNLEHFHRHDAVKVLQGFLHVLNADGFAHIAVPDIGELMRIVVQNNLDIDDFLYQSMAGPILVRDVLYGYGKEIESSGNDYFAHKTGFTQKALSTLLVQCGFARVFIGAGNLEVVAYAFKNQPSPFARALLQLPP